MGSPPGLSDAAAVHPDPTLEALERHAEQLTPTEAEKEPSAPQIAESKAQGHPKRPMTSEEHNAMLSQTPRSGRLPRQTRIS